MVKQPACLPYIIIRIDEPAPLRVIVPLVQVIQAGFRVPVVPSVAEGVVCAHGLRARARNAEDVAPRVVVVGDS